MRNGFGQRAAGESLHFLYDLRDANERIDRILRRLPSLSGEDIAELSDLLRTQRELLERNPRFHSADERFETDQEKFTAMHLMQRGIKAVREYSLRNRGAQPGNRCG
jgi:hypothetical protein